MNPNIEKAFHDYEALIAKENQPAAFYNGIYTRTRILSSPATTFRRSGNLT